MYKIIILIIPLSASIKNTHTHTHTHTHIICALLQCNIILKSQQYIISPPLHVSSDLFYFLRSQRFLTNTLAVFPSYTHAALPAARVSVRSAFIGVPVGNSHTRPSEAKPQTRAQNRTTQHLLSAWALGKDSHKPLLLFYCALKSTNGGKRCSRATRRLKPNPLKSANKRKSTKAGFGFLSRSSGLRGERRSNGAEARGFVCLVFFVICNPSRPAKTDSLF